jgi:hypothetical protein
MYRVTNRVTRSSFVVSHMYDMGPMTNYPRKGDLSCVVSEPIRTSVRDRQPTPRPSDRLRCGLIRPPRRRPAPESWLR